MYIRKIGDEGLLLKKHIPDETVLKHSAMEECLYYQSQKPYG